MPALVAPVPPDLVRSEEDWRLVEQLILDLESKESREPAIQTLFHWRAAMRAFWNIEFRRMRSTEATPQDLRWHRLILGRLIAIGEALLGELDRSDQRQALETCGVRRPDLDAAVAMLRHNWEEWHADVPAAELESLKRKIFGGQA